MLAEVMGCCTSLPFSVATGVDLLYQTADVRRWEPESFRGLIRELSCSLARWHVQSEEGKRAHQIRSRDRDQCMHSRLHCSGTYEYNSPQSAFALHSQPSCTSPMPLHI